MPTLCEKCPKRNACVELCEKAERYVNQDYASQRETTYPHVRDKADGNLNLPLDNIFYYVSLKGPIQYQSDSFWKEEQVNFPFLSDLQNKCLQLFYFEALSYAEIAQKVNLRVDKVSYQLRSAKRRILQFFSKNRGGSRNVS